MSSANIGWLFYKGYFQGINFHNIEDKKNIDIIKEKVETLIQQTPQIVTANDEDILGNTHFQATTTYPGLILGSGNAHELPKIEGQAILGFSFDYTSGLPVISGSSIKGVIRSAFDHPGFIKELLNDDTINVKAIEKEIFENNDIFHDATIIKADSYGKILGDDYLAPHGDDQLKNPIPLRFIKVLPNVTFRFDFDFSDGTLTKSQKSDLCKEILSTLGLGAKTNVGYGKFETFKPFTTDLEKEFAKEQAKANAEAKRLADELELQRQRDAKAQAELDKKTRLEAEQKAKEDEEKAKKEAFASQGIEAILEGCDKYKQLENNIKKYIQTKSLSDSEKDLLESHILNMPEKLKKRKDFPFGTFGNDKCFGKERANQVVDKLGL